MQTSRKKEKTKALRLFVDIFCILAFLAMVGIFIYRAVNGTLGNRLAVLIANSLLWLLPFLLRPIFREKISESVYAVFAVFTFFAALLGSVLGFYSKIWWYDLLMHTLFGYLGGIISLFFVCKLSDINKLKPAFVMFVCFAVSMMFAALWEIFEFSGDVLLGNTAQGTHITLPDGSVVTPLQDTMEDILCNFVGAIVFILHYLAHILTKKSLLIGYMKDDFSPEINTVSSEKE